MIFHRQIVDEAELINRINSFIKKIIYCGAENVFTFASPPQEESSNAEVQLASNKVVALPELQIKKNEKNKFKIVLISPNPLRRDSILSETQIGTGSHP